VKRPTPVVEQEGLGRRDFLRLSLGGLTVLCFPFSACHGHGSSQPAAAGLPVGWIETGLCTGRSCALLDCYAPPGEQLLGKVQLGFHETLMGDYGARAMDGLLAFVQAHAGKLALVVDGAIAVGAAAALTTLGIDGAGTEHTAQELVTTVAGSAAALVAVGTCASFGGIPGSGPGAGTYVSLAEATGKPTLRAPGCPPNPLWIGGLLDLLAAGQTVDTDALGRPTAIYAKTVHEQCPRLGEFALQSFAEAPGDPSRCLLKVGCKGMIARGDCPTRAWHGRSYCMKAGHPCLACTAPGFLDAKTTIDGTALGDEGRAASPFYQELG
jgi:NiFe hydrogenase small subunit HydA